MNFSAWSTFWSKKVKVLSKNMFSLSFSMQQTGGLVLSCKCGKALLLSGADTTVKRAKKLSESKNTSKTAPNRLSWKLMFEHVSIGGDTQ